MRHIVGAFSTMLVLLLNLLFAAEILSVSAKTAEVKSYKAAVIAEIENSNFNPHVIRACQEQAKDMGYELEVSSCMYEENYDRRLAKVTLKYDCAIPLLGIEAKKVTYGIAR